LARTAFASGSKSFNRVALSRPRLVALLLALVMLAVYLPDTRHEFFALRR